MPNLSCIPKFVKKEVADVWVGETWKLLLLNSTHVPYAATQQYAGDVVANEISDSGGKYIKCIGDSLGGVAITGKASVIDGNNYFLDATDVIIGPGANLTYRYGILVQVGSGVSNSKIRAQIDFLTDQVTVNGTSTIQWNALGIIYLT